MPRKDGWGGVVFCVVLTLAAISGMIALGLHGKTIGYVGAVGLTLFILYFLPVMAYWNGAYDYTRSTDIEPGEYPVRALWCVFLVTHIVLKHGEAINGWYRIYEIQSGLLPPDLKEGDTLIVQRDKFKGRTYTSYRKKTTA